MRSPSVRGYSEYWERSSRRAAINYQPNHWLPEKVLRDVVQTLICGGRRTWWLRAKHKVCLLVPFHLTSLAALSVFANLAPTECAFCCCLHWLQTHQNHRTVVLHKESAGSHSEEFISIHTHQSVYGEINVRVQCNYFQLFSFFSFFVLVKATNNGESKHSPIWHRWKIWEKSERKQNKKRACTTANYWCSSRQWKAN